MSELETLAGRAHRALHSAGDLPSPCVSVCRMNAQSGRCEGCLRTLDEIARWGTLGNAGKRDIWLRIGQRASALQKAPS